MIQVCKIQGNASALVDYNRSGLNIKIENFLFITCLFSINYVRGNLPLSSNRLRLLVGNFKCHDVLFENQGDLEGRQLNTEQKA